MRIKAVDVPDQEAITRDNISVKVNAVIYYKISSAEQAILRWKISTMLCLNWLKQR